MDSIQRLLNKLARRGNYSSLSEGSAVIEFHGDALKNSAFLENRTIVDDFLIFASLCYGTICQPLYQEAQVSAGEYKGVFIVQHHTGINTSPVALKELDVISLFEQARTSAIGLDKLRVNLAIHWFFASLREFELGNKLTEAALAWVTLETQAKFLSIQGNKFQIVESLLAQQAFSTVPTLNNLYFLRNKAFHEGSLSSLSETDADAARIAGGALVRAQILNLFGVSQTHFQQEFTHLYLR